MEWLRRFPYRPVRPTLARGRTTPAAGLCDGLRVGRRLPHAAAQAEGLDRTIPVDQACPGSRAADAGAPAGWAVSGHGSTTGPGERVRHLRRAPAVGASPLSA